MRNRLRPGVIEKNLAGLAAALDRAAFADEIARRDGLLQKLDPRAKIVAVGLLIAAVVSARSLWAIVGFFGLSVLLAVWSRIPLRMLATQAWVGVLAFTGAIALPAIFLTPGDVLSRLPVLGWPITAQGVLTAVRLIARAETTATLALTLVLSTPWTHVLKALRVLRAPTTAVVILGMTHRYIFLLLRVTAEHFVARRSRSVGRMDSRQRRQAATGAAGALLGRSLDLSDQVYSAMRSRGYRGEVYALDDFRLRAGDVLAVFLAIGACWLGIR